MAPPSNDKFPKPIPLEVSVYGTDNGIQASKYGAKRLLLSHKGSQSDGGLTPTVQELRGLKNNVFIPINCTIRPPCRSEAGPRRTTRLHLHQPGICSDVRRYPRA
ncbi:hypothetical protein NW754_011560 [Fusarium falciforme]|nr:hypothetical protein NW754_011560 [Fusarium falciforme]